MRCPDCGNDYPVKPEVVIQKEPCRCGLTESARVTSTAIRFVAGAIVMIILSMSGCTAYIGYLNSQIAEKGDSIIPDGMLHKAEKKP